ncbi:glycosyltransferase family 10 domain-containing protein [Viridibacterium curvum]|uniref:Fucosyltransferase C-terminal domain-containing protein n=1 Tax=Viridibacterium curvum TaxID=1101404 RepID=A0ABP9QLK5_9RHOO
MSLAEHAIFLEPSSAGFLGDKLFDTSDRHLNRDGTLLPFARLREYWAARGVPVHTADALRSGAVRARTNHYWSFGMLDGYGELRGQPDVRLRGFVLFEPPLVLPAMYARLPALSQDFEQIHIHNTVGDLYSLDGVDAAKLRQLFWPQPYDVEQEPFWSRTERSDRFVIISGNHNPKFRKPEYYSKRIEAVGALASVDAVDLYGRGWERWFSKQSAWWPYWWNIRAIRRSFRGSCNSKLEVLSRYRFSICFENTPMRGYFTEKMFDCLYAGTVPIYLGAPDIEQLVPQETFVDARHCTDFRALHRRLSAMPATEWQDMREAGRAFLRGIGKRRYFDALMNICEMPFG